MSEVGIEVVAHIIDPSGSGKKTLYEVRLPGGTVKEIIYPHSCLHLGYAYDSAIEAVRGEFPSLYRKFLIEKYETMGRERKAKRLRKMDDHSFLKGMKCTAEERLMVI